MTSSRGDIPGIAYGATKAALNRRTLADLVERDGDEVSGRFWLAATAGRRRSPMTAAIRVRR